MYIWDVQRYIWDQNSFQKVVVCIITFVHTVIFLVFNDYYISKIKKITDQVRRSNAKSGKNTQGVKQTALCVISYDKLRYYQPKMANGVRDENVYNVFLQRLCTFCDVLGIQLTVNGICIPFHKKG